MNEEWRDVTDPRLTNYEVSSLGHVRNKRTNHIRKAFDNGHGYLSIGFKHNGKHFNRYVHQMLIEAFIGEIPEGHEADHINHDTYDNTLANLRIVTHSENQLHRRDYEERRCNANN